MAKTGKKMCELIAARYHEQTGKTVDPHAIWEISPTGELWPVVELYEIAKAGGHLPVSVLEALPKPR